MAGDIHGLELDFAKNPTIEACIPLCEAYLAQKRFMEAMVVCKKGIKSAPTDARGRVLLAKVYRDQGKLPKAEQELTQALAEIPPTASLYEALGRVQLEQGRKDDAIGSLQKALAATPDFPGAVQALQQLGVSVGAPAAAAPAAPVPTAPVATAPAGTAPSAPPPMPGVRPAAAPAGTPMPAPAMASTAGGPAFIPASITGATPAPPLPGVASAGGAAPTWPGTDAAAAPQRKLETVQDFFAQDTLGFSSDSAVETAGPGRLTILGFVPKTTGSIKTTLVIAVGLIAIVGAFVFWQLRVSENKKAIKKLWDDVQVAVNDDQYTRYTEALKAAQGILAIDDGHQLTLSAMAYAEAVLATDHAVDGALERAKENLARADAAGSKPTDFQVAARALIAYAERNYEQGLADIKRVQDQGGSSPIIELEAFRLSLAANPDSKDTDVQLRRLTSSVTSEARVFNFLGWYYYQRENWGQADEKFDRAQQNSRGHALALIGKSLVDLDRGIGLKERQKEVEAQIRAVFELAKEPDAVSRATLALAHFARAQLTAWRGDAAEAEADYKKAFELDPNNAMFDYKRGVGMLHLGRTKEALESLRAAVGKQPNNLAYTKRLAEALMATGDFEGAKAAIERAAEKAPADAELKLLEGKRLRSARSYDAAVIAYQKIGKEDHDAYSQAQLGIAAALRESGKAQRASALLETYMGELLGGTAKETETRLWCELGLAYEAGGERDKALQSYQAGIDQYRYLADCHYYMCRALGRGAEGKASCETYLALAPNGEFASEAKRRVSGAN